MAELVAEVAYRMDDFHMYMIEGEHTLQTKHLVDYHRWFDAIGRPAHPHLLAIGALTALTWSVDGAAVGYD